MEKLKDIIHDYTDVILAVVIAGIMFVTVGWNLGNWFTESNTVMAAENPPVAETPLYETTPEEPEEQEAPVEQNEPAAEEKEPEVAEQPSQEAPGPTTPAPTPEVTVVEVKSITVPSGTPGIGIARILVQEGLIENTAVFIEAAERLNLSLRLKSGTFEITTNTSVDDMVRIIAEVKR